MLLWTFWLAMNFIVGLREFSICLASTKESCMSESQRPSRNFSVASTISETLNTIKWKRSKRFTWSFCFTYRLVLAREGYCLHLFRQCFRKLWTSVSAESSCGHVQHDGRAWVGVRNALFPKESIKTLGKLPQLVSPVYNYSMKGFIAFQAGRFSWPIRKLNWSIRFPNFFISGEQTIQLSTCSFLTE